MIWASRIKRTLLRIAVAMLLCAPLPVNAATTLLPNAMQCFSNADGPLAGGSVYNYYPSTSTMKQTWQDSSQSVLNSQPIVLDSNGCALIYGVGSYRQVLYTGADNTTTLVWDQLTTDTSAYNSVFWAGLASGTANTITITYTGFNATDGTQINFVALATNTSSVTLNPSSYGAISIVKDTTAGPTALTGGEIIAGNIVSVIYYATDNRFHLVNTVIGSASGTTAPLCGATGLLIVNNTSTPNSIINMTADDAVMLSTSGQIIHRSSISLTSINISTGNTTSTANGMDGTSPGTSQWLYIWMIDNGSAAAGLVSTSATAPTMPSGYTYKCRMGAMRVNGSGFLERTRQVGNTTQYVVSSSVTTALPVAANGIAGTFSVTAPVWSSVSLTSYVPTTATKVNLTIATRQGGGSAASNVLVAPNSTYVGPRTSGGPPWSSESSYELTGFLSMVLEATTIQWVSSASGGAINVFGWVDKVNAN